MAICLVTALHMYTYMQQQQNAKTDIQTQITGKENCECSSL